MLHVIAGIAWDPQIRGFLAVGVGVVVLMGSVYLLLGTNLGARLGFLVAMSATFGWCMLMGITWWAYGNIGMLGEAPSWEVKEVLYESDVSRGLPDADLEEARILDTSGLPPAEELNDYDAEQYAAVVDDLTATLDGWELLPESNPSFGEAKATVDEYIVQHPLEDLEVASAADFIATYSFERGGKEGLPDDPDRLDRITTKLRSTFWELRHPPHYAIIQLQPLIEQELVAGEPPPSPKPDPSKPEVSVVMVRNLGDVRFPAAMLTIFSGMMFAVTLSMLHRRDLRVAEVRGLLPATTEG